MKKYVIRNGQDVQIDVPDNAVALAVGYVCPTCSGHAWESGFRSFPLHIVRAIDRTHGTFTCRSMDSTMSIAHEIPPVTYSVGNDMRVIVDERLK